MAHHFQIFYDEVDYRIDNADELLSWLDAVVRSEGKESGEVNIIFVSDDRLLEINKDFLQHDYYTDVITFDDCKGSIIAGEVYVSIDRVIDNAESPKQIDNERDRVCLHGFLHLLGYKDKSESQVMAMRSREDYYLNLRPYVSRET